MEILKYHLLAFFLGFILDLLFGDPHWLIHPVVIIGKLISFLEDKLLDKNNKRNYKKEFKNGLILVLLVLLTTFSLSFCILFLAYYISFYLGIFLESIMTYQVLAIKSLRLESMKVYYALKKGDLKASRRAVSMIVGRDTQFLDEIGVTKAAIETVAENTSDGVIAPMLYAALGGPILAFIYKAINTMDSMIGYKNEKYLYFGRAAAKLDDIANYLPARISAYLMIFASFVGGKNFNYKRAYKIYKRDKNNHKSPNAAHTEAVCAGALGIQLAGDAFYFRKLVKKPYIGDKFRNVDYQDIKRANKLMYITSFLCEFICLTIMAIFVYF